MLDKRLSVLILASLALVLSACSSFFDSPATVAPSPVAETKPTEVRPSLTPTVTEETPLMPTLAATGPFSPAQGAALTATSNDWFATAGVCVVCHQNNEDQAGNDVSYGEYWRSTMMANAARDPYYLASVSAEVQRQPEFQADIETKCSSCHMPMAHFSNVAQGQPGLIFGASGYLTPQQPLHTTALDGVSCTTCHQIQDEGLGDFDSFSGGIVFDLQTQPGQRAIFGPFIPSPEGINVMASGSEFVPQQGMHLLQSELCATCHNLYTNYIAADGGLSDDYFPEQTPYSEWLNSDYATQATCQDCHMPIAHGSVVLANQGPQTPRSPYAKHSFVGGNAYLLNILKNFGGEIDVQAGTGHFDATIARTLAQLQSGTAILKISDPVPTGTVLSFDVTVNVYAGHKFPTGYPSRRAWLHVTVKDAGGQDVFESGAVNQLGAINGNDNDADPATFEPHYAVITSSEQVQIYEPILQDVYGNVTTGLFVAASYVKDNRLLPTGFDKTAVTGDIAPQGAALTDDNFDSGTHTITYRVDTGDAQGPFSVEVEFLYQSIGYRWAQNVNDYESEAARIFGEYYNASPNLPIVIVAQSIESR